MESLISFRVFYGLTWLILPVIVTQKKNPVSALAWVMATILIPFVGPALYLLFGTERMKNRGLSKLLSTKRLHKGLLRLESEWAPSKHAPTTDLEDPLLHSIIRLCHKYSFFDAVAHNRVDLYTDVAETYAAMEEAIQTARHHIHVNYFIFQANTVGERFADLLIEKAREGVKVHFLFDLIGSRKLWIKRSLVNKMRQAGVEVETFLPWWTFIRPWSLNLRNHRKILLIDNTVAFTGSLNIGDSFLGTSKRRWRETTLRIEGPAVSQLQWIFGEDWFTATEMLLSGSRYFAPSKAAGENVMQVVASGPDERREAVHHSYFMAISGAKTSIYLTTPYFVPDDAIYLALKVAALRGVDVKLLVQHQPDHYLVWLAGRSYYDELLRNQVEIYEYQPGILHAKMLIVDGKLTIIGSSNLDIRSFRYNFEVNIQIYGQTFSQKAESIFFRDLEQSVQLGEAFLSRPAHLRFRENVMRLTSPLL